MNQTTIMARLEPIAELAHTMYAATNPDTPTESWGALDEHRRQGVLDGVKAVLEGAVSTPQQAHENWMRFKQDAGWTQGPVIDTVAKQHPCICSWESLPEAERGKDRVFVASVIAANDLWEKVVPLKIVTGRGA